MSEFEEKLNAILNNPEEMEKIACLASALMGGGPAPPSGQSAQSQTRTGTDGKKPQTDAEMLGKLSGLLGRGTISGGDKSALLQALAPYLKPERQIRLQKALRAAKLFSLARTALALGGEDGV